jgi:hypothetical protein
MFELLRIVIGFVAHPRNSYGDCRGSLRAADSGSAFLCTVCGIKWRDFYRAL